MQIPQFNHYRFFADYFRRPDGPFNTPNCSSILPVPTATQSIGSSAKKTGIEVSILISRPRPRSSAPPPVSTIPASMISAASSGGVCSQCQLDRVQNFRNVLTDRVPHLIRAYGGGLRRPLSRSRPFISCRSSPFPGCSEPICCLICSAVISPIIRLYFFFTYCTIALSNASPATRIEMRNNNAAKRNHSDLSRPCADVNHHASPRLFNRKPCTDRSGQRFPPSG